MLILDVGRLHEAEDSNMNNGSTAGLHCLENFIMCANTRIGQRLAKDGSSPGPSVVLPAMVHVGPKRGQQLGSASHALENLILGW